MKDAMEQLALLKQGAEQVIREEELVEKLKKNKPLRIKVGVDPTAPDLHLGHTVLFNKAREFQQLGHHVMFLIGDFTALIGDPTGRNVTRKVMTEADIIANAKTYQTQIFKILDPQKTEVVFNSTWMKPKSAADLIQLTSLQTVARMLEREDFKKRYTEGQPIAIHEFLYPLMQGYDSVAMEADVELGGTDQTFNLLMGRELQRHFGQDPQVVLTMPLLEGTDGEKKMSKSYGNYIGVDESPVNIFGKIMSISDVLMWRYIELLSFKSPAEKQAWRQQVQEGSNPRDIKMALGQELVDRFHGVGAGQAAQEGFIQQFQQKHLPDEIPRIAVQTQGEKMPMANVLKEAGLVSSTSEANRLIKQGALKINEAKVIESSCTAGIGETFLVQVGKHRFAHIKMI